MTHETKMVQMASSFNTRLSRILRRWVTPLLEPYGFQRRGNVFAVRFGNMAWVVDVQLSQWGNSERTQFTLNCGVYIAGVTSVFLNREEPVNVELTDCCIHARAGMLAADKIDKWWELRMDDATAVVDRAIGEDLVYRLKEDVIPFLKQFETTASVLEFLGGRRAKEDASIWPQSSAISFCYAATIASLLGKREKMSTYLEQSLRACRGKAIEEVVLRVADHLRNQNGSGSCESRVVDG